MRLAEAFAGELDFDQLDSRGLGSLHWCVTRNEKELFTEALAKGAPVNQLTSHTESSPLHYAAEQDSLLFTKELLSAGAEIDAVDRDRRTPLHLAVDSKKLVQVRFLIESGCVRCPLDRNKWSPLDLAFRTGNLKLIEYLTGLDDTNHRSWSRRLLLAAELQQLDVVDWLLAQGANPLTKNKHGQTPIDLASTPPYGLELDAETRLENQIPNSPQAQVIRRLRDAAPETRSEQGAAEQPATADESNDPLNSNP